MIVGSLFTGIGGFDLAARWMGWTTAWMSENDPYASAVLAERFPGVPNVGDITQLDGHALAPIDVLCGGFPCQDISIAGKGAGLTGTRSGLWTHYARLIEEIRPSWVVIENSPLLRRRGLHAVLARLDALGYDAEWHCISAAAVGAPHQRDRIWIIAKSDSDGRTWPGLSLSAETWRGLGMAPKFDGGDRSMSDPGLSDERSADSGDTAHLPRDVADARSARLQGHAGDGAHLDQSGRLDAKPDGSARASRVREREYTRGWWLSEPQVGRVVDGFPGRMDQIKCLGNALVPDVPYRIFQAIEAASQ